MSLRKIRLPPGWYPQTTEAVSRFLEKTIRENRDDGTASAAAAPHAGWRYSGAIAARAFLSLKRDVDTVLVIGGHIPGGMRPLMAEEDAVETPLGDIPVDTEFRIALGQSLDCLPDQYADNTVEVQLPMVRYFFPAAKLLWLRFPADESSFESGKEITRIAEKIGRNLVVLGSTDLTHYGNNYGYSPQGGGKKALAWVRDVNDANFIAAVKSGDPRAILDRAEKDRSACSAGAILGALGFAKGFVQESGVPKAELLAYGTSAGENPEEGEIPDSFVGYGAFCWR
ncbi:AmmeMemoRadiSam system protein B [Treponema primitia]|uniref:AmmeMemoRadiSam system protein B n=1 Tax=Treponema primitia TaxID=88058 RepID=UPI0002554DEF|nr:AmmeMemoRadiSam system protein B [Treponema primitia]